MDDPCIYEIRIKGQLTERWSDWFGGLAIQSDGESESTLQGTVADQAALFGLLNKLHALNLILVSVNRVSQR
jgi:hypothetical protein